MLRSRSSRMALKGCLVAAVLLLYEGLGLANPLVPGQSVTVAHLRMYSAFFGSHLPRSRSSSVRSSVSPHDRARGGGSRTLRLESDSPFWRSSSSRALFRSSGGSAPMASLPFTSSRPSPWGMRSLRPSKRLPAAAQTIMGASAELRNLISRKLREARDALLGRADPTLRRIYDYLQRGLEAGGDLPVLYKIADALKKRFGGENAAKSKLRCGKEFKVLGRSSNQSSHDERHAPESKESVHRLTPMERQKLASLVTCGDPGLRPRPVGEGHQAASRELSAPGANPARDVPDPRRRERHGSPRMLCGDERRSIVFSQVSAPRTTQASYARVSFAHPEHTRIEGTSRDWGEPARGTTPSRVTRVSFARPERSLREVSTPPGEPASPVGTPPRA